MSLNLDRPEPTNFEQLSYFGLKVQYDVQISRKLYHNKEFSFILGVQMFYFKYLKSHEIIKRKLLKS